MKKRYEFAILLFCFTLFFSSCSKDEDLIETKATEYKEGMSEAIDSLFAIKDVNSVSWENLVQKRIDFFAKKKLEEKSVISTFESTVDKTLSLNFPSQLQVVNSSLIDLMDYPVNIISETSVNGGGYLTVKGKEKTLYYSNQSNGDNQLFYIRILPLSTGGGVLIYTFIDGEKYYVSSGVNSANPNYVLAYTTKNTDGGRVGVVWDFLKGETINEGAYVISNATSIREDNSGNIYHLVLGNDLGKTHLKKYKKLGNQEFIVKPLEDFKVLNIEYNTNGQAVKMPDFMVKYTYNNGSSVMQSISTKFKNRASYTSEWTNTTNNSIEVSTDVKVGLPFFAGGSVSTDVSSSFKAVYGKEEVKEDTREYDIPLNIPPYTKIVATATVGQYKLRVGYTATLKGEETGRVVKVHGVWSGVSLTEINVVVRQYDVSRGELKSVRNIILNK